MRVTFLSIVIVIIVLVGAVTYYLNKEEPCDGPVTCYSDEQCGGDIVTETFCRDGNLYAQGQRNVCEKKNTCESSCITTFNPWLVQECKNGCEGNACNN